MGEAKLEDKWELCSVAGQHEWHSDLLSIRIRTGARRHLHGQFVRLGLLIGDELVSRPYSLVSTGDDSISEIIYTIVPDGALTPKLRSLKAGSEIYVSRTNYGNFVLEEIPSIGRHLWCCGTGTGIGPFLPMIQSAVAWGRFEKIIVLHGARHHRDLAYRELLLSAVEKQPGRFHYHPVLSRDESYEGLSGRITAVIADGRAEQLCEAEISPENSQFMLCGNAAFIDDQRTQLLGRGLTKNLRRTPGNITVERYWG